MANIFSQPGVFQTEKDETFIGPAPQFPGACFIGLSSKGPAFTPTIVNDWQDFTTKFGNESPSYFMPYAAKGYLKYNSPATVMRVLGKSTYTSLISGAAVGAVRYIVNSQSIQDATSHSLVFGEIYTNTATATAINDWRLDPLATMSDNFTLHLTSSTGTPTTYSGLTLNPESDNYFKKVLGSNPIGNPYYYIKGGYNWNYQASVPLHITASAIAAIPGKYNSSEGSLDKYSNARTTWFQSQNYGPDSISLNTFDLFKLHNLSDGDYSNT